MNTRVPAVAFFAATLAALVWASWAAFRPRPAAPARASASSPASSAMSASATTADPQADIARARAARRFDAVSSTVAAVLLEHGVTRGDVREELDTPPGPSGFPATRLAVDVPGASGPVADALQKRIGALEGAVVGHDAQAYPASQRLVARLDGVPVVTLDLFAAPPPAPPPEIAGRPRVAIVIDDLGYSKDAAEKLLAISHNLTYSVLPYAPYSTEIADLVHGRGGEVMLHLPMEPEGRPGGFSREGMLLHGMPAPILAQKVDDALARVPLADGVNNHMGSRLTADPAAMRAVMQELAPRHLFFLDSRTSPETVAYRTARAAGLRALERDVFLDDVAEIGPILKQVKELEARAKKRGTAVAIGHPYPATIKALEQAIPTLIDDGLEIVPARDLATAAALTAAPAQGTP